MTTDAPMVPAGYMARRVRPRPPSIQNARVADVYSVSGCISPNFADYINDWRHNGYWFFDRPEIIQEVAREHAIDLEGVTLFYFEVYREQFDGASSAWSPIAPEPSFPLDVVVPSRKVLEGYDIVSFFAGSSAECSPLSCNALSDDARAAEAMNAHCLLPSLEHASGLLEGGLFEHGEPGPYRIFAVFTLEWPGGSGS
jgi:hypothetical protein